MSKIIFDRIYGRLRFPKIVYKLLKCPGLQRLRGVRMSNVPFVNFPSFSSINRFEHSLGTCHLAQLASESLNLSYSEKIELMCACLYHDVATPPFAHITEEILNKYYGFDHEQRLYDLLTGRTEDPGMEKAQVFMGKSLILHRIVQSKIGRTLGLDIFRIADIAIGKGELGFLVKGEIDLDNIDNVIRAVTAMGIKNFSSYEAETLARSFLIPHGEVAFYGDAKSLLKKWQSTRLKLYDMIYGDVEDFSFQTMLKQALDLLAKSSNLLPTDWSLTDEELIYMRMIQNNETKKLTQRILLNEPYPCRGVFSLTGSGSYLFVTQHLLELNQLATEYFKSSCVTDYTIDKRRRILTYPLIAFFGERREPLDRKEETQKVLLYIFSSDNKYSQSFKEPDYEFFLQLKSLIPGWLELKPLKRVVDDYPRLVEVSVPD
jgi:HD superfamily phosphohydrolase